MSDPLSPVKTDRNGQRWPRLHLVYFVLALFDVAAVGGGLYLSHQLRSTFEESAETNSEWNSRFVSIWNLGELAADVNAPANEVFDSKDVPRERARLAASFEAMTKSIDTVRAEIVANAPRNLASQPVRTLTYVDQALKIMVGHAERTLTEYQKGDIEKAAYSMALLDRSFKNLRDRLNESVHAISQIQVAFGRGYAAKVHALERFEWVLGGAIILMVGCVMFYGHMVSRFLTKKYMELQLSHEAAVTAELEARTSAKQQEAMNTQINELNAELRRSLDNLRLAQDEAVRKTKFSQLGELTATVAHELRNPLGAVRTSAFLLDRKLKGKDLGIDPQLQRINSGIRRCDDIISQLLDFARTTTLNRESVSLDEWLPSAVEQLAQDLPAAVSLELHLGAPGERVLIDPLRMTRALLNLMHNAAEAMVGRGDVATADDRPQPRIVLATARTSRGFEITVTDNGPGIPDNLLDRVREPLFTTKSFGTGLGLPAVQKILEQHDGGLDVASRQGQGASLTIWWPVKSDLQEAA